MLRGNDLAVLGPEGLWSLAPRAYRVGVEEDKRVVHVVAKTHLDLGFTALASEVTAAYRDDFFPRAIEVALELEERDGPERLVWTTGAWIMHHALVTGSAQRRDDVDAAIRAGNLAWHALPVTTHTELMDADLFRVGLGISAELDSLYGRRTVAAKMTDVPGHTRSMVPLLAEAGVGFLHIGVNPAWPMPDVPAVFRWVAPDRTEVVVAYQASGYGGEVVVPGCDHVLAFIHTADNLGPPTADEVIAEHARLAARHPGAEVRASTLDGFASALLASPAMADLPVVTSEIGDPWVFGAASDPQKLAAFRALLRVRRSVPVPEAIGLAADRELLLVAEHTWGLDQKEALPDDQNWSRGSLAALRSTPAGQRFESSWAEQRSYVDRVATMLSNAGVTSTEVDRLAAGALDPSTAELSDAALHEPPGGFQDLESVRVGKVVDLGSWFVALDPETGALSYLVEQATGRARAGAHDLVGLLSYQSFDASDYERFYAGLTPSPEDDWWARWDNTKPGIDVAGAVSGSWTPTPTDAWMRTSTTDDLHAMVVRLEFPDEIVGRLGAPPVVWMELRSAVGSSDLDLVVQWPAKPANRLPEAMWWSFDLDVAQPDLWTIDKMGQQVSPLDVVGHGGRSLHAVGDGGLSYGGGPDGFLRLLSHDASLVAPGRPNLLDADPPVPDLSGGWHVLLLDNCWGTNFPMWPEGAMSFRVTLASR